jgi:hypothetical protein
MFGSAFKARALGSSPSRLTKIIETVGVLIGWSWTALGLLEPGRAQFGTNLKYFYGHATRDFLLPGHSYAQLFKPPYLSAARASFFLTELSAEQE